MKKIIVVLMVFMLWGCTGCSNVVITDDSQKEESKSREDSNFLQSLCGRYSNRFPNNVTFDYLEEMYGIGTPDDVDISVNDDLYIGFLNYLSPNQKKFPNWYDEVSSETHPKSIEGIGYTYYGKLNHLDKNIYSAKGSWITDLSLMEDLYQNETDFYCIIEEERIYVIFEEINNSIDNFKINDIDKFFTKIDESEYVSDK